MRRYRTLQDVSRYFLCRGREPRHAQGCGRGLVGFQLSVTGPSLKPDTGTFARPGEELDSRAQEHNLYVQQQTRLTYDAVLIQDSTTSETACGSRCIAAEIGCSRSSLVKPTQLKQGEVLMNIGGVPCTWWLSFLPAPLSDCRLCAVPGNPTRPGEALPCFLPALLPASSGSA